MTEQVKEQWSKQYESCTAGTTRRTNLARVSQARTRAHSSPVQAYSLPSHITMKHLNPSQAQKRTRIIQVQHTQTKYCIYHCNTEDEVKISHAQQGRALQPKGLKTFHVPREVSANSDIQKRGAR